MRGEPPGPGPLDGVRVVEIALWVAGPATAAVLADWGASVVKVEPLAGDPQRHLEGLRPPGAPEAGGNPTFDVSNRGKRSVALDLKSDRGREVIERLLGQADVLVTNLRVRALERLGLDHESVLARHPRLVYALMTGYGLRGPHADAPGYDSGAFWARSGLAASLTVPGGTPPFQRGAMGDRSAAAVLAGGVSAALLARERTGTGQLVAGSLYRWGTYLLSSDLSIALQYGAPMATARREAMASPTVNCYRCADDRWVWLIGLERDRHWPPLVRAVGQPAWLTDERFATSSARQQNARTLIASLDTIFAEKPRDEWLKVFDECGVWAEPVNTIEDVLADEQFHAAGGLVEVPGTGTPGVNGPLDFGATPAGPRSAAPALGADADAVLGSLGYTRADVDALRSAGVVA
ncbi:CaiB/BaiF CoA transferase family protein [Cryptosporangium aurantiacum]|uniref:Crotonobetainyl-CoA:carnitine CoA-transferase CaiB n=1 Tax=Cryptosporangium aurantiacum TaxID=134849 RepID=A0A1M7TYP0_9ACTN|nr:CoA transferase [Cryptosporangium aurantiacum]SHN75760.1 Crotonobetainyl-CoA:carnitine CoA-transferase CaiB [Cryptosporangium aurantiacum]